MATVFGFQRFHQFGPVRQQAVLQVDRRQWGREIAQVRRWCPHLAAHLAERPMGGRDRVILPRHGERQALGIVARSLHANGAAFHRAGGGALGTGKCGSVQIGQREIPLVIGAREPFGRYAGAAFAARWIDPEAAGRGTMGRREQDGGRGHGKLSSYAGYSAQKAKPTSPSDHHFPRGILSNRRNTQPLIPEHDVPVTYRKSRLQWGGKRTVRFRMET
ncbi:hypothetical protein A0U92_15500 [Acetobacter aceti]|uniref:Uncharacterized protein n=1 Tax=Acetobacter aceti TaxID=435 RepID=A0A1U9KJK6_ACEAC|nr:hypothetical protein A0U92_15500 [Acetobacter aceti]